MKTEIFKRAVILAPVWLVLILCGLSEGWVVAGVVTGGAALVAGWVILAMKVLE